MAYIIAAYEVDKQYGGPEEGGWWYDSGDLKRTLAVRYDQQRAYNVARKLNRLLDKLQKHLPSTSSMGYHGGRYRVQVFEEKAPEHYPETRPYYQ